MKFHIYGACAGTEPIKGWRHLSFSVEHNGLQYFFDAGESCAYNAYIKGIDVAKTRRVVISHTHMDHVGGLANLLWYIRKLDWHHYSTPCPHIDIHIPNLETFEGIMKILKNTEGNFVCNFEIQPHEVCDGLVFDEDGLRVTAFHNTHLPRKDDEPWRSFGYLIECEGKKVFFTGDYGNVSDFADVLKQNEIDLLLIETGHHSPEKTSNALKEYGLCPKLLGYIHNGADVRRDPESAIAVTEEILGTKAMVFREDMDFDL